MVIAYKTTNSYILPFFKYRTSSRMKNKKNKTHPTHPIFPQNVDENLVIYFLLPNTDLVL